MDLAQLINELRNICNQFSSWSDIDTNVESVELLGNHEDWYKVGVKLKEPTDEELDNEFITDEACNKEELLDHKIDIASMYNNLKPIEDYVDLGLSVLWATHNVYAVGADNGDYYTFEKAKTLGQLPTKNQFQELVDNCDYEFKNGYAVFTSKINRHILVLPAAGYRYGTTVKDAGFYGYYWSSSEANGATDAYNLYFNDSYLSPKYYSYHNNEFSVRLVKSK